MELVISLPAPGGKKITERNSANSFVSCQSSRCWTGGSPPLLTRRRQACWALFRCNAAVFLMTHSLLRSVALVSALERQLVLSQVPMGGSSHASVVRGDWRATAVTHASRRVCSKRYTQISVPSDARCEFGFRISWPACASRVVRFEGHSWLNLGSLSREQNKPCERISCFHFSSVEPVRASYALLPYIAKPFKETARLSWKRLV